MGAIVFNRMRRCRLNRETVLSVFTPIGNRVQVRHRCARQLLHVAMSGRSAKPELPLVAIRARTSHQMPNETHIKRLIADAVFEVHNTLRRRQAAGDRLYISREDSRTIAGAVFDVLIRANVLLIDQPGQSNPETPA
jgi:hypothetical protein